MVALYADSNRVFGKHNGLSEGRVVSLNKNEYFFCSTFSVYLREAFGVDVR